MESPRIAVFTAVDAGTSRAAIRRLHGAGIPVIPVSIMTVDEIAPIAAELGLRQAMIIEDGGAIARWKNDAWEVEPCGPTAETFLDAIAEIEDRSGASVLVYSALEESRAARFFSEPFVLESGEVDELARAAAEIGYSLHRGRRFLHLCRTCDKGNAFLRLCEELECDLVIGIGDPSLDAELLSLTDVAIVVQGPDGWEAAVKEILGSVPRYASAS